MAKKKLGEILLEKGVIQPTELKKALDAQLIFGGRLGTNLIELGFLEEPVLAQALEEQHAAGLAGPERFRSIPSDVIRLLPKSLVQRHHVVPLEADEKTLTVAMQDPNDLVVLDEITFVTGLRVQPLISPEARILEALETYYGLSRPKRFVRLSEEIRRQMSDTADEEAAGAAPEPGTPWAVDIGRPDTPESELVVEAVSAAHEEQTPEPRRKAARRALEEVQRQQREEREASERRRQEKAPPSLEEVGEILAAVETRDEIGEALLDYAAPRFQRAAMFLLQKSRTLGWCARGEGTRRSRIRSTVIPGDMLSVFDALREGTGYYLGAVEDLPGNEILLQGLGGGKPEVAFLMPVTFHDRLIAALYGDGPMDRMRDVDVRTCRALTRKAGLALEMLLLRHRILQETSP